MLTPMMLLRLIVICFGRVRMILWRSSDPSTDPDLEDIDLGVARYVPVSLEVLMKSTKFSRKEIQLIYCGFKQDCPTGVVSADKFRELYSQFFPLGDATVFARQIFQMMDQDMDGSVSFEEFLVVMSMLSRGSIDEKLQWVFNLYDLNGEGFLTVDSMIEIGASIYEMLGKYTDPPVHEATVREHVTRIFIKMDSNADGIVTFSEFKEFCVNDDKIRHNFCVFNSVL
ncbi:Kv channel-interacting protein 4 [Hypsibius exemplaris]|uniref:Kv channel-interacting protein 4 n=1 Tax=Hypsibius exemplaris TaxID=2072580 RepID=A0A1W0XEY0_HYPEX|nr:Kv channel-interacting protein 4 [Hypsibius exemplaris]